VQYTSRSDLLDDTCNDFSSNSRSASVYAFYLLPVGPIRFDMSDNPDPEEIWNEGS